VISEEIDMTIVHEPLLHPVPIDNLRPTQMTVGMREVQVKRDEWKKRDVESEDKFLGRHMIPVVRGPNKDYYITDHHHLVRALHEEGVAGAFVLINADLSILDKEAFWVVLDNRGWMHPFDANGKRREYSEIPQRIEDLLDDPYRSLAGGLRRSGGYAKDTTPFSEFLWADFLRRRISNADVAGNFEAALKEAFQLAKSKDADYLPGWCGLSDG
jgi:hypothetical protein